MIRSIFVERGENSIQRMDVIGALNTALAVTIHANGASLLIPLPNLNFRTTNAR
jgi:hypothetical protein